MLNESIKGKISDFEQFLKLLEFLGDNVLFKLTCEDESITFCSENEEFTIMFNNTPITVQDLKKKLSKWAIEKGEIIFTIVPAIDKCPDGDKISKKDLKEIIDLIRYVRQIPSRFKIKILDNEKAHHILKTLSRHPIERETILSNFPSSLIDLCKWEKEGIIKIEKINFMDRIAPLFAGIAFIFIAAAAVISFFPFGRTIVTYVKMQEIENTINSKRILNYRIPEILPVKDAFLNRIYYKDGKLISPGPDRKIGTQDDIILKLPNLGNSSLFVIP